MPYLLSIRETADDRQKVDSLKLCLKKIEEVIALTLDSRLSADFRQKRGKARQKVDRLN